MRVSAFLWAQGTLLVPLQASKNQYRDFLVETFAYVGRTFDCGGGQKYNQFRGKLFKIFSVPDPLFFLKIVFFLFLIHTPSRNQSDKVRV